MERWLYYLCSLRYLFFQCWLTNSSSLLSRITLIIHQLIIINPTPVHINLFNLVCSLSGVSLPRVCLALRAQTRHTMRQQVFQANEIILIIILTYFQPWF